MKWVNRKISRKNHEKTAGVGAAAVAVAVFGAAAAAGGGGGVSQGRRYDIPEKPGHFFKKNRNMFASVCWFFLLCVFSK